MQLPPDTLLLSPRRQKQVRTNLQKAASAAADALLKQVWSHMLSLMLLFGDYCIASAPVNHPGVVSDCQQCAVIGSKVH